MGEEITKIFVRFFEAIAFVMLLVILPLTLWLTWSHHDGILSPLVATLFMCSVAWMAVSAFQLQREIKRLGLSDEGARALLSGHRPSDRDELRIWRWGWQFGYAVIAAILFLILIPIVDRMILG